MNPDQAATLVNNALRDGSPEERRRIGSALADSGLLYEAIDDLMAENHESCYGAFSLLFLVAKAGVVEPLSAVIEKHPSLDVRLAVIRLLASSGEPGVVATSSVCPQTHLSHQNSARCCGSSHTTNLICRLSPFLSGTSAAIELVPHNELLFPQQTMRFKLQSEYQPKGDQPAAIEASSKG